MQMLRPSLRLSVRPCEILPAKTPTPTNKCDTSIWRLFQTQKEIINLTNIPTLSTYKIQKRTNSSARPKPFFAENRNLTFIPSTTIKFLKKIHILLC